MNFTSADWPRVVARNSQRFLRGFLAAFASIVVLPLYGAMNLRFDGNSVVVTGATHGAQTLWISLSHEAGPRYPRIVDHSEFVTDDDRDGVVRLTLDRAVHRDSIWAVVDMASGEYVIDTPAPGRVRHHALPSAALHRKGNGKSADVQSAGVTVFAWCVRPGAGAWNAIVDDGTSTDADAAMDGKVRAALSAMTGIEGTNGPPPDDFAPGDIVFAIDILSLDSAHARIALSQ